MQRSSQNKGTSRFEKNSSPNFFPAWLKVNRWRKIISRPIREGKVPPRETETSLEGWMEGNGNLNLPSTLSRPRILSPSLFVCVSQSDWSFSHSPSVFFFPPLNSSPVLSLIVKSLWSLNGLFAPTDFRFVTSIKVGHFVRWKMSFREHVLGGEKRKRSKRERGRERGKRRCSLNDHRGWWTPRRNLIFSPVETSLFISPYFISSPRILPSVPVFGSLPPRLFGMHTERSSLLNAAVLLSLSNCLKRKYIPFALLQDFVTRIVELSLRSLLHNVRFLSRKYYPSPLIMY